MLSPISGWFCMFFHSISTHYSSTAILFALLSLFIVLQSCFSHQFFFACHPNLHPSLPPVDVWSVGCIVAEMIRGSVLFPGTDRILPPSLVYHLVVTSFWVKGLYIIQRLPVSVVIFSTTSSSLCRTNLLKKMSNRITQVYSLLSRDVTVSKSHLEHI